MREDILCLKQRKCPQRKESESMKDELDKWIVEFDSNYHIGESGMERLKEQFAKREQELTDALVLANDTTIKWMKKHKELEDDRYCWECKKRHAKFCITCGIRKHEAYKKEILKKIKEMGNLCEGCGCPAKVCSDYKKPVIACCPDCKHTIPLDLLLKNLIKGEK